MGSTTGSVAERPIHRVHVSAFHVDAGLVTNAAFARFVADTGYVTTAEESASPGGRPTWRSFAASPERAAHPVVCVSWYDACAFATWAGKRLPTEAEWERAATADRDAQLYPWGAAEPSLSLGGGTPYVTGEPPPTTSVPTLPANPLGIFDLVGHVWQWCADWYDDAYYVVSPSKDPTGPDDGTLRCRRGGAWNVREPFRLRCANRGAMRPEQSWPNLGFRCVRSLEAGAPPARHP